MKDEFYQYAISIKKRSNGVVKPITGFGKYFIIMFFSVTMLVTNVFLWIISLSLFVGLIIYEHKENDEYARALFDIGIFLIFICMYMACIPIEFGFVKEFVISMIVSVLFYELAVFLSIKSKKYSSCTKKLKKEAILCTSGVLTGLGIGRFISKNATASLSSLVLIFISVTFFIFSITFIQRYLIYKILKDKYK